MQYCSVSNVWLSNPNNKLRRNVALVTVRVVFTRSKRSVTNTGLLFSFKTSIILPKVTKCCCSLHGKNQVKISNVLSYHQL